MYEKFNFTYFLGGSAVFQSSTLQSTALKIFGGYRKIFGAVDWKPRDEKIAYNYKEFQRYAKLVPGSRTS